MAEGAEVVILKRWQMTLGLLMGIAVPLVSIMAAYYSKQGAVQEMIVAVDRRIDQIALDNERRYVRRDEFTKVQEKLDLINAQLFEIKGYLRNTSRRSSGQ